MAGHSMSWQRPRRMPNVCGVGRSRYNRFTYLAASRNGDRPLAWGWGCAEPLDACRPGNAPVASANVTGLATVGQSAANGSGQSGEHGGSGQTHFACIYHHIIVALCDIVET